MAAPKQSLQRQLADGLRYLVRDKFKLNQPDGPSDGWLAQDALWLVSKPIADQLRAYLLTQGVDGVPSSNAPFFNMLQDQGVIQTNAQDKAIWKATIDNGNGWKNTFTLLKLSPALIWNDPSERPPVYAGTLEVEAGNPVDSTVENSQVLTTQVVTAPPAFVSNPSLTTGKISPDTPGNPAEIAALMDLLDNITSPLHTEIDPEDKSSAAETAPFGQEDAQPAIASSAESLPTVIADTDASIHRTNSELGQGFVEWLRNGLVSRRIIINDTKALVHTVSGTAMLVTPGIFKRYVQEFPAIEVQAKSQKINAWQLVQRSFEKQKLHRKTEKSLNIWTCKVTGPRTTKQLRGYLLKDPLTVFAEVPFDNASLSLVTGAKEGVE